MLSTQRSKKNILAPWQVLAVLLLAWSGASPWAAAQQQPGLIPPPSTLQPPPKTPQLPPVPERDPRPAKGPDSVGAFLRDLSNTDSVFEVLLGQGRILTLKEPLAAKKKEDPLVAVGDPTIVDFTVLNGKQIRIVGRRMGVTDFSITTGDGQTYNFEIRVVADLSVIHGQLQRLFPEAKLRLGQVRDHIVVEGEAKTGEERTKILLTIRSYLDSVKASQVQGTRDKGTQPQLPETYLINLIRVVTEAEREIERKAVQEKDKNDLKDLEDQLKALFPDARLKLAKLNYDIAVSGQARDQAQVSMIVKTIESYLITYYLNFVTKATAQGAEALKGGQDESKKTYDPIRIGEKVGESTTGSSTSANANVSFGGLQNPLQAILGKAQPGKVINLLRVPGARQVLLKVRIAELNRTALRQVGADFLYKGQANLIGDKLSSNAAGASVATTDKGVAGMAALLAGGPATIFGVFENSHFAVFFNALRKNDLLKILAEPNLVALDGHKANFLAGGEFPVPVPQNAGAGGATTITIEFKKFGVSLDFLPYILDGGMVRLAVDPEVSSIDFSIGTSINGTVVPGLNTRKSHTVVEIKEGQTLAIAGLLQVSLEGNTNRIPGIGDVPIIGPFFSNTTHKRQEKELIVLVTPYLVEAMPCEQVPPYPGAEVNGPNDLEFYLGNRIEGRTGRDRRLTTQRYTVLPGQLPGFLRLQDQYLRGPHGFSD